MEKHRTKVPVTDPIFPSLTLAWTSQQLLPKAVLDTRLALRDFLLAAGLKELRKAFEEDRTLLCGPKGKVQTDRRASCKAALARLRPTSTACRARSEPRAISVSAASSSRTMPVSC